MSDIELADPASDLEIAPLLTGGNFATEADACIVLDDKLDWCELFTVYKEVTGWYSQPRIGCAVQRPRVDRLLTPKRALIDAGWQYGAVAIEVKASGVKIGPMIAQAMDYGRASFEIAGGIWVTPKWTFLWPAAASNIGGTVMSILVQNRIGIMHANKAVPISFWANCTGLLRINADKSFKITPFSGGNKTGSR